MADWADVRALALALPETSEEVGRTLTWRVRTKSFAWERPLRPADLVALGAGAPTGEILGARIGGEEEKGALIAEDPAVYFTTPHFNGYPAILVQLDHISLQQLEELLTDAWLMQAPKRVAAAYLASLDS